MNKKAEKVEEQAVEKAEVKAPSKFQQLRGNHKFRIGLILFLMAVVAVLFVFFQKARVVVIAFIALLAALGLEVSQKDFDLGKLWETKSLQESQVKRDTQGNILFDKLGNIVTDTQVGKRSDEYNCDDFSTQPQAQAFYQKVGGLGNDVNRLDGDKDGTAYEGLPTGK